MTDQDWERVPPATGDGPWSNSDLLLALVADRLAVLSWQQGGDPNAPYPPQIPRPGVGPVVRPGDPTPAEKLAYLVQLRADREQSLQQGQEVT